MPCLWESWAEYCRWCHPAEIFRGSFNLSRSNTRLESAAELLESVEKLRDSADELRSLLGRGKSTGEPNSETTLAAGVRDPVIHAIHAGETLLLYYKRLAMNEASYDFLHQNDLMNHWERYASESRILYEAQKLLEGVDQLLDGYARLQREAEQLLLEELDLPKELESDFRLSRDLFSVGFDEVGLFVAARGLERVLREIARQRKIILLIGSRSDPAADADLHDLIETMSRIRWKVKGTPIITKETKSLLQYIRTVRNSGVHSGREDASDSDFRQTSAIIARSASRLWNSVATSQAKLASVCVQKNWP